MDSKKKNRIITIITLSIVALCVGCSYYLEYKYPPKERKPYVENYADNSQYHQILAKNHFADYIKKQMNDPKSYEEVTYSSVYNTARHCYVVDLTFRGKNAFGATVIERWMGDVELTKQTVYFRNVSRLQ